MEFTKNIQSDDLADLRELFSGSGFLAQFGDLLQVRLVLDANAVLADIRWLACKAKKDTARTNLLESLDAKTIVAYAPTYLVTELKKNIPIIALEEGVHPDLLWMHWKRYEEKIRFVESGGPEENSIDPKDVPYLKLNKATGYPVLTVDPHLEKMGASVVGIQICATAKSYSREASVEYTIKAGAIGSFTVTGGMANAAKEIIRELAKKAVFVPPWAWIAVIAVFCFAMLFAGVRNWLLEKIKALPSNAKKSFDILFELLVPLYEEHLQRKVSAQNFRSKLESEAGV